MIAVELTPAELILGGLAGVMRHAANLADRNRDGHGFDGDRIEIDVHGALAELAAAKALDFYWTAVVRDHRTLRSDVGRDVQIRSTTRPDGCLIVRDTDPDDAYYLLVVGTPPAYRIVGSIRGGDAKRGHWRRAPAGREAAYFVPQSELAELPRSEVL